MLTGLYMSAAGLQTQEYRQSVTANNLANAQTTGFKRDFAVMQARLNAAEADPRMAAFRQPGLRQRSGGVWPGAGSIDLSQGSLNQTGNQSDVALEGPGFFTLQGDKGEKLLTRDGRFLINNEGFLINAASGRKVLSAAGEPISLNPALPLHVTNRGYVQQGEGVSVQLGIVDTSADNLSKRGANTMAAEDPTRMTAMDGATVRQGFLEQSAVDPVVEMVNMLEGQRVFEANARMLTYQDQTLQQLNMIGRVA